MNMRTLKCGACIAAMSACALPCAAQTISASVSGGGCDQAVHLVAREAPLSSVLQRLADTQRFRLVYRTDDDPIVTADERLPVMDLVRRLAREVNYSVEQATEGRCTRLAFLAVLPDGSGTSRPKIAKKPAWQTPEYERIAKQGLSDYLRSHGIPDQPVQELEVR